VITSLAVRYLTALERRSVLLVFCCTLAGAAAQILIKVGASSLSNLSLLQMVQSIPLLAGYSLYGVSTLLLVLALRQGELSVLYPIISLTYVWVTLLSMAIFQESMNLCKALGLVTVVVGVSILGQGNRR
jgi:multidrug transporter EmrE-like cation transporter